MPRVDEICARIDEACTNIDTETLECAAVSPALLRDRAEKLLALTARISKARDVSNGSNGSTARKATAKRESSPAAEVDATSPATSKTSASSRKKSLSKWADSLPSKESLLSQSASCFFILGLTLPYYVCVTYYAWFVDEGFAIYRNPDARGETPVMEVLQHDFWGTHLNPPEGYNTHKSWRPLITLSYAVEWQLAQRYGYQGQEMKPMRLFSCMVHSVNSILVLWLLRRLRIPVIAAVVAAGLFATHPIHIENIVYLVGRADSLSTTFYMLAILLYLRQTQGARAALSASSYACLIGVTALAGICKEPGFTALFFLACAEVLLRFRWRHVVGLLMSFAIVGGLRIWYVGGTEAGFGYIDTPIKYQEGTLLRTLSYLFQHACYAKLLVLPWHQSWDYSFDALPMVRSMADVRMLAILSAYLAVLALAAHGLRVSRKNPALMLGLGLVVIPFIPASNLLFLVGTTVGERLLYPCTVGSAMVIGALLKGAVGKGRILLPIRVALGSTLLLIYIWNSNVRMSHWKNTTVLFTTDAQHWGRSAKVLHSQGSELQAKNDLEGALDSYLKSLEVFDDQAITDYCIARLYLNLNRVQEAYQRFDKILNGHGIGLHDGNDFLWMTDLGYTLVKLETYDQGMHYLQQGLERMPHSCYAWNALGVAQAQSSKLEQAAESLVTGLQCDPDSASIWSNLAVVYAYGNAGQQANEALQKAVTLNSSNPVVVHNVNVLTGKAGQGAIPQWDLYIPLPGRR